MAYWGVRETAQTERGGKVVSWVPVTDQAQEMRIRLKTALIDVKSGCWESFSPESFQDIALSARYTRESSDQTKEALLKAKAHNAAGEETIKRYIKK